jgi:hypothetical protein
MSRIQVASKSMLIGGTLEILVAILHFAWPFQFSDPGGFADVADDFGRATFLCIICIGLCQLVFGALSIYFSRRLLLGERSAWVYGISQGILWGIRTIFELWLPVRIPFLFVSSPTGLVLPLCLLLALLFLIPLVMGRKAVTVRAG